MRKGVMADDEEYDADPNTKAFLQLFFPFDIKKLSLTDLMRKWFTLGINPHTKQEDWLYNGGYWDRNYTHIPDIF
uniref:Uncharacterized protein n=1 Tax=Timema shepardi TaxID=629360 RepID=A0A7R9B3J2_TIMSH|nr:unnamed protein product [Timema shepardi]